MVKGNPYHVVKPSPISIKGCEKMNHYESLDSYVFVNVDGHIEVFLSGVFQFSADTMAEAQRELLS